MAVSLGPVSDPGAEMTLLEINQELQSQLEQSKQDFRDLKQKFLVSESTAYILANQLQKYKSGACKDIIESVLGEKLQFQEGKPTEKSTLAEKLKKYDVLIQDQARELAQLRQTIEKGREVSVLLKQHLRNLLTHDDPTNFQGQGFQERLAEGCRLVKRLARKLSPENHAEEENKEEKASVDPSLSTELQEKESVKEALKGSVDEGPVTSSSHQYTSGSHEPPSTNVFLSEEHEDFSALVAATEYSHQQEKKAPTGLPETQKDQKDEDRDEPTAPSWELQEEEEMDDACQDSLDEKYLALSSHHDLSDSCHPPDSPTLPSDEHEICSRLDGAQTQKDQKDEDRDEPTAPSWELQEEEEMDDACQDSLDEKYLALSSHHDLSDSCHPPDSPTLPSDEHEICSRLDGAQTQKDQKDEDRDEPTAPSWELQEEEEMDDACQDSLDEKYLALSSHHDLSDSCHPPDSPTLPSDEHEICSRLDGAQSHEDEEYVEEREPLSKMNDQERVKDREFEFLIRLQARELTQLRLKTREGRELSLLLNQNLKELLGRSDLNNLRGQAFQEQLAEGCRLSQALVSKLGPENHEEEAEEQLGSLTPRKYHFLIHDHARKLTQIRQTSREGRELSVLLHQHLRDLLTHSDIGRDWGQGFQEQLAEGSRLAERLVHKLSPENLEDDDEEEEQESLSPSLERELLEKEIVNEILPDPSGEQNSTPSSPRDLSASGEPLRSTAFPCDEPQVRLTLEAATPSWEACQQGPLSGNLSFQRTEMQTSQAPLEPSSWGSNYLGLQLDQFHCGDGKATLGLSFTTWSFAANSVPGNRGSLFQELGLDASLRMKTPPTLKGDALECSDASKQGCQVIGHIDASIVIQQRILKRKLRLSKWRLACRFPGLQA
ncbi:neuroblastoma breakpoint family member 6-like [Equus caballus]|uniref:neuroblastoma breakpoint family member 6-like n=1 Tax=Equus caballus TaxID=9796 RepID=UPI0038B2A9A4